MPGLEALAAALRGVPDAATTVAAWRSEVGDAFPIVQGCLAPTRELAQGWPCGAPGGNDQGCARTLVEHARNDLVAVCDEGRSDCPTIAVSRGDAVRHRLDLAKLGDAIAPCLHLHVRPAGGKAMHMIDVPRATAFLGVLRVDKQVAVALTLASTLPHLSSIGRLCRAYADQGKGHVLLLAPLEGVLAAAESAVLAHESVEVLPLHDAVALVEGRPRARLSTFIRAHHAPGLDPSPWFHEEVDLVVDPLNGCAWFGERRIEFGRTSILGRMFYVLARRGGAWVDRVDLIDAVWGEEADTAPLSKRKSDLQKALDDAGCGVVIETERSDDEDAGAYRLPIASTRVDWWSAEPMWTPPKAQRKSSGTPKRRTTAKKA